MLIEGPMLVHFNLIFGGTEDGHKVTIRQMTPWPVGWTRAGRPSSQAW